MPDQKLYIPLLLGTPRKDRESERAAKWVFARMQERDEIETEYFDVRSFDLPSDDYGQGLKDRFPEWRDAIVRADGLVLVTPEYNHGYPGAMKSVLDLLLREYIHKPVSFVGVSSGPWGGTRVIEACIPMVRELGLAACFTDLNFPLVASKFNEVGEMIDPAYPKRVSGFLDELVWMATTFRWGRQNVPSRFHS